MSRSIRGILKFLLIAVMAIGLNSCSKEDGKHHLTIVVVAKGGIPVSNALVKLYVPVENSFIDWYDYTDDNGEVEYTFDNTVIVEIAAGKGSFKGCSSIEVEQGENTRTIELKPYNDENNGCISSSP